MIAVEDLLGEETGVAGLSVECQATPGWSSFPALRSERGGDRRHVIRGRGFVEGNAEMVRIDAPEIDAGRRGGVIGPRPALPGTFATMVSKNGPSSTTIPAGGQAPASSAAARAWTVWAMCFSPSGP